MPYLVKLFLFVTVACFTTTYYYFNEEFNYLSYLCATTFKLSTSKQIIIERDKCLKEKFEDANIITVNNHTFETTKWPYNKTSDVCSDEKKCLQKFVEIKERPEYFIANTTKTVHCTVRKNMSRIFKLLACLLNDPTKFFNTQKDLIKDAFQSYCNDDEKNKFRSIQNMSTFNGISNENGWSYVMIVRDPLERFVSGYIYACLRGRIAGCTRYCNNCGANLTCFMEKHEKNLEKMIKTGKGHFGTTHLYPQSWTCEIGSNLQNYTFLYYNSNSQKFFDQELGPFLRTRNVSNQVFLYIRDRITSARTKHSNTNFKLAEFLENRIKSSPYLLEKFVQMYYHDYRVFNYTLPKLVSY